MLTLATMLSLAMLAGIARSTNTLPGPTGLIATPTAAVVAPGQLDLNVNWYNTKKSATDVLDSFPLSVEYGLAPGWEVGVNGWIGNRLSQDANSIGVNAKYMLPVKLGGTDWSLGGIFAVTQQAADASYTENAKTGEIYFVGTRPLLTMKDYEVGLNGTLGVNWTSIDAGAENGEGFRGQAGLEVLLPMQFSVFGEYQTARPQVGDDKPLTSAGVRYPFTPYLVGQVVYTNAGFNYAGLTGAPDHNISAGLTLMWDTTKMMK